MISDDDIATAQRVLDACVASGEATALAGANRNILAKSDLRSILVGPLRYYVRADLERFRVEREHASHTICLRDAARLCNASEKTLKDADTELKPIKVDRGGRLDRWYRPSDLLTWLAGSTAKEVEACPPSNRNVPKQRTHVGRWAKGVGQTEIEQIKTEAAARVDASRRRGK